MIKARKDFLDAWDFPGAEGVAIAILNHCLGDIEEAEICWPLSLYYGWYDEGPNHQAEKEFFKEWWPEIMDYIEEEDDERVKLPRDEECWERFLSDHSDLYKVISYEGKVYFWDISGGRV